MYFQCRGGSVEKFVLTTNRRIKIDKGGSLSGTFRLVPDSITINDTHVPYDGDGWSEVTVDELAWPASSQTVPWQVKGDPIDERQDLGGQLPAASPSERQDSGGQLPAASPSDGWSPAVSLALHAITYLFLLVSPVLRHVDVPGFVADLSTAVGVFLGGMKDFPVVKQHVFTVSNKSRNSSSPAGHGERAEMGRGGVPKAGSSVDLRPERSHIAGSKSKGRPKGNKVSPR